MTDTRQSNIWHLGAHHPVRLFAVMAILFALGCSSEPERIRIAVNPWPGYAFLFLADELGLYTDEGLTVQLVELSSLGDVRRTFEHGQAEAMACTAAELVLTAQAQDSPPRLVVVTDTSHGADQLLAQDWVKNLRDLCGRRIAYEPATMDVVGVSSALDSVGLTLADVQLVPMAQDQMAEAFARGEIDAVQCYPPLSTQIRSRSPTRTLFDSSQIPGRILDLVAISASYAERNPQVPGKLFSAYKAAVDYYRRQPERAIAIMARRTGVSPEQFRESLRSVQLNAFDVSSSHFTSAAHVRSAIEFTARALNANLLLPVSTSGSMSMSGILQSYESDIE